MCYILFPSRFDWETILETLRIIDCKPEQKTMYFNTTEKDTVFQTDTWHSVHAVFNENDNLTTRRNWNEVPYDDEINTRFQFQFFLNNTTLEVVVMYICVVIFFFGIIGNIVTMAKILCDSKYHKPTFAAIGYLASADFFSLISLGAFYFTNFSFFRHLNNYFAAVDNSFYFSCSGHMLLLSIVRYLITVHPLQSRQLLTVTAVSFCSLSIWVLSTLCGIGFAYNEKSFKLNFFILLVSTSIFLVIICAIIITLHTRKIRAINNSLSKTGNRQSQTRMNVVFTAITAIFVLFHIFLISKAILRYKEYSKGYGTESITYVKQGVALTAFLNSSCNPYILFISFSLLARLKK